MSDIGYRELVSRAAAGYTLNKDEIISLLDPQMLEDEKFLLATAAKVCENVFGNSVLLRGIIEFSNYCAKNCLYCGLRGNNTNIARYRLSKQAIVESAKKAIDIGCPTIVLQSGEDDCYEFEDLLDVIRKIKNYAANTAVTVSVGLRSKDEFKMMREAGADRYLMKQETASPELFSRLRPGTVLEERLMGLRFLKEIGLEVGSGMMVGLPGQTLAILAEDILLLASLNVEMAGIGPFIAHHETPLKNEANGSVDLTLRAIAITRLLMPKVNLPATTALGTLSSDGRKRALQCGANVIMPNVSPQETRELYSIYPEKMGIKDCAESSWKAALEIIESVGKVAEIYRRN